MEDDTFFISVILKKEYHVPVSAEKKKAIESFAVNNGHSNADALVEMIICNLIQAEQVAFNFIVKPSYYGDDLAYKFLEE